MKSSYDMELFLTAVLKGAHTTRRRHINQARLIQAAIQQRWQRDNPWRWQLKHLQWFMREHLAEHAAHSRYYYGLTVRLIVKRLGKERNWGTLASRIRAQRNCCTSHCPDHALARPPCEIKTSTILSS